MKLRNRYKKFGPFEYWHCKDKAENKDFISAWFIGTENAPFGWEWGSDNMDKNLIIEVRVGKLQIIGWGPGQYWFMGFWYVA